jgi:uncharacterized peroxidase-related enzyme
LGAPQPLRCEVWRRPCPTFLQSRSRAVFLSFAERGVLPLLQYHDAVLRSQSELTVGEREIIAAYVSSINDCHYCFSAHRDHAKAWGIPAEVFGNLQVDVEHAGVPERMRPILAFARRLTVDPAGCTVTDARAIYDADVISGVALYNFMNRILDGGRSHSSIVQKGGERRERRKQGDVVNDFPGGLVCDANVRPRPAHRLRHNHCRKEAASMHQAARAKPAAPRGRCPSIPRTRSSESAPGPWATTARRAAPQRPWVIQAPG